jgi:hypothetical protein
MHYHPLIRGMDLSASAGGVRWLGVYINDEDHDLQGVASEMGYVKGARSEPMSHFAIPRPFPAIPLPPGFRLMSLADDNDLRKVDRVLWRGFDHGDEPPEDGIEDRKFMRSAPNFRTVACVGSAQPFYLSLGFRPAHNSSVWQRECAERPGTADAVDA